MKDSNVPRGRETNNDVLINALRNKEKQSKARRFRFIKDSIAGLVKTSLVSFLWYIGAPVAQWVKRWPTDLADRVRSPLEAKSCQP